MEESFARQCFPDTEPLGRSIVIRKDTCIVGGVVRIPERSLLKDQFIIKSFKQPDEPATSLWVITIDLVLLRFREGTDIESTRTLIDTLVRKEFPDYFKNQSADTRVTSPVKDIYFSSNNSG